MGMLNYLKEGGVSLTQSKHSAYDAVDLMKIVASILVIVIHTHPFRTMPLLGFVTSNIFARMIIPFFFISSGYFLHIGKNFKSEGYFKKYIFKLIKLYLIWSIIYIPFGIHSLATQTFMDPSLIQGWLWIGALFMAIFNIGTYFHLWYMAALIFAIIFCHFYLKKFSLKSLIILGVILYSFSLVETYYGLISNPLLKSGIDLYFSLFFTTRNGLFVGILYVALGIFLADKNRVQSIKKPLLLSTGFFVLLCIEAFNVRALNCAIDYNVYIFMVPFTTYWFVYLMNKKLKWNWNYKAMREYSTLIYFSHGIFLEGIPWLLAANHAYLFESGWFRFFSVLIPTLLFSWLVHRFRPKLIK